MRKKLLFHQNFLKTSFIFIIIYLFYCSEIALRSLINFLFQKKAVKGHVCFV